MKKKWYKDPSESNWVTEYKCECGHRTIREPVCEKCGSFMERSGFEVSWIIRNNNTFRTQRRKQITL